LLDKDTGLLLTGNFGDWLAVFKVDSALVSSSFFVRNLNTVAAAARVLGYDADAERYEGWARAIGDAFIKQWWDSSLQRFKTAHGFQTSIALPLFAGICSSASEQNISTACARAVADVTIQGECPAATCESGMCSEQACFYPLHVTGGIMGAEALLPALSMAGRSDVALAVALQPNFPSWSAMTRDGSGTLWELWDGALVDPEGSSRNHVMFSSVRTWAGVAVAGLSALHPGWTAALVAPDWRIVHSASNNISSAGSSVVTPAGIISASWSSSSQNLRHKTTAGSSVRVIASLPPPVSGIVCVPCFNCASAIITESSSIVWNGSSGFQPGVAGIRAAELQQAALLVRWSLAYPGAGASIAGGDGGGLSACFEVDSGSYLFESN